MGTEARGDPQRRAEDSDDNLNYEAQSSKEGGCYMIHAGWTQGCLHGYNRDEILLGACHESRTG